MVEQTDRIIVYSVGLCCCSVCVVAEADIEEITQFVNLNFPTGISSHWALAKESFSNGQSNPHICERHSNRLHYLFSC